MEIQGFFSMWTTQKSTCTSSNDYIDLEMQLAMILRISMYGISKNISEKKHLYIRSSYWGEPERAPLFGGLPS